MIINGLQYGIVNLKHYKKMEYFYKRVIDMRLKQKISYLVQIPNHWYYPKVKKWIHEDILRDENNTQFTGLMFTNILNFKTCKVFKKHWPIGTIITKKSIYKGQVLYTDYVIMR